MLNGNQAVTELIDGVYEAVADHSRWDSFLRQLGESTGATSAVLLMLDIEHHLSAISRSWQVDPEATRLYLEHYSAIDVWAQRGVSKPAGYVCNSEALIPLPDMARTEIYNEFMAPFGIEHGMFGVVDITSSRWASISLFRNASSTPFDESHAEMVRFLIPHIQRAFRLHSQFCELKARTEGVEGALNLLATGVIFLGAAGEVLLMNRRAEIIVNCRDGLVLSNGKLSASIYTEATALRGMIEGAALTGSGKGMSAGGAMLLTRERRRPLSITVAPLRKFNLNSRQPPAAVMFISDPEQNAELPADLLRRCYGLTPAEVRLTMPLVEGRSLKEAADSSGVTYSTARSQLKSIFQKTQVQRQGELIRLLLSSPAVAGQGVTEPG